MSETAAGRLLPRAWMHSKHRYNPRELGPEVMHVRETKPHALSRPGDDGDAQAALDGERQRKLATLTDEERQVIALQGKLFWLSDDLLVSTDDHEALSNALESGYQQVGYADASTLKLERQSWRPPTYEEIGNQIGLSARQVHRRVVSANRKLKGTM